MSQFAFQQAEFPAIFAHGAVAAFERYGKGRKHRASLNFGDCLCCACAKAHGAKLLFKGDDFAHTDVAWAWAWIERSEILGHNYRCTPSSRSILMPTISIFFGIAIRMFFSDHPPPHFHVAYQRYRAVIAIESGAIISGALPPAVHRLVREWAGRHRAELLDNWQRARERRGLQRIPGADVE